MSNKGRKFPATEGVCTAEEVSSMMAACNPRYPTGRRNAALVAVLYRCGLRISEALALRLSDVRKDHLAVHHGKGDKSRLAAMDEKTHQIIRQWLEKRKTKSDIVFCTLDGGLLSTAYVRALFKRLARKASIGHRVHAHGLRHTHAFELANENIPLHVIKEQLGHSSVATTDRYISHLNPRQRITTINARPWNP